MTTVEAAGDCPASRVLILDNHADRREIMRHLVAAAGMATADIAEAATVSEATTVLSGGGCDVAVVEIQMPVAVGLETIAAVRSRWPGSRIVVCSFHSSEATKARAYAQGADVYLDKPVSSLSLRDILRHVSAEAPPAVPHPSPTVAS